jgi:hypothetical protein
MKVENVGTVSTAERHEGGKIELGDASSYFRCSPANHWGLPVRITIKIALHGQSSQRTLSVNPYLIELNYFSFLAHRGLISHIYHGPMHSQ